MPNPKAHGEGWCWIGAKMHRENIPALCSFPANKSWSVQSKFNWIARPSQMRAPKIRWQHVQNTCWLLKSLQKTLALTTIIRGGLYICPSTNFGYFRYGWTIRQFVLARFDIPKRTKSLSGWWHVHQLNSVGTSYWPEPNESLVYTLIFLAKLSLVLWYIDILSDMKNSEPALKDLPRSYCHPGLAMVISPPKLGFPKFRGRSEYTCKNWSNHWLLWFPDTCSHFIDQYWCM